MKPLVSVVIPTYNHRDTVVATVESVLAQTVRDLEIIIVNDGSPDDTHEVLRPYLDRVRYVEQANAGQGAARNKGISIAVGEFVALLDDDDLWPADKLAWQVEALRRHPEAVLVYGEDTHIDSAGNLLPAPARGDYQRPSGQVYEAFLEGCWIASPGQTLIRRSALDAIGGFDDTIWGSDDWELYLRLAKAGPFLYEDRLALLYRLHGGNSSGNVLRHLAGHEAVTRKHPAHGRTARQRRRNAARYFRGPLLRLSHARRLEGDLATSLAAQRAALRLDPSLLLSRQWLVPFVLNLLGHRSRTRSPR